MILASNWYSNGEVYTAEFVLSKGTTRTRLVSRFTLRLYQSWKFGDISGKNSIHNWGSGDFWEPKIEDFRRTWGFFLFFNILVNFGMRTRRPDIEAKKKYCTVTCSEDFRWRGSPNSFTETVTVRILFYPTSANINDKLKLSTTHGWLG